jgi:hypothetical protein
MRQLLADTLPPELLKEIGELIVRWSNVEFYLVNIITKGFGIPIATGRALAFGMPISAKTKVLRHLANTDHWIHDEELRLKIKKYSQKIDKDIRNRNNFAHGIFGFDLEGPDVFYRFLLKEQPHSAPVRGEEINVGGLKNLVRDVQNLGLHGLNLMDQLERMEKKSPK